MRESADIFEARKTTFNPTMLAMTRSILIQ